MPLYGTLNHAKSGIVRTLREELSLIAEREVAVMGESMRSVKVQNEKLTNKGLRPRISGRIKTRLFAVLSKKTGNLFHG